MRPRAHTGEADLEASSPGERAEPSQGEPEAPVAAGLPIGYNDVAPLRLLVTEAGGLLTDLDGNDVLTGNGTVLAANANGHIHDEMPGLVHGIPHARDYKAPTAQRQ